MSDWLDDLDVNELPDDEFTLPRNTYLCRVVDIKSPSVQSKNEDLAYFIINWQIDEGEYETYSKFGQWIALPPIYAGEEMDADGNEKPVINTQEAVKAFNPRDIREHKVIIIRLKKIILGLGYGIDEVVDIIRKIRSNDFSWTEDRMALVTANSYKDAGGYTKVNVSQIAPYEGTAKSKNDVDIMNNDIPF